jgi:hypothetical protein
VASTGQHRLRWSCPSAPSFAAPSFAAPHAAFIPWKSSSGRSSGQPATLDCSGNAGIVPGEDWVGWNGKIVAGSGFGRPVEAGRRMEKKTKTEKTGRFGDIGTKELQGSVSLSLCERGYVGGCGFRFCFMVLALLEEV